MLLDNLFTLLGIVVLLLVNLYFLLEAKKLHIKLLYSFIFSGFSYYLYLFYEMSPTLKLYLTYLKPLQALI